jgi:LmbE family N-acetylglucosaminyl deacetylase
MRSILFIGAHPDDDDLSSGGLAALCRQRGDEVLFVSVTNGDKGHFAPEYIADPALLARRRIAEGEAAVAVIGARFATLDVHDGEVYVTPDLTEAMVRLIRGFGPPGQGPDLVLLNRPNDYHRDHRYTARLVLDATYMLTVPPFCPDTRHLDRMPVFAYWYDRFTEGGAFRPDVVLPIDSVMAEKVAMALAHESQLFEWLPFNAGASAEVPDTPKGRREYVTRRVRTRGEWVKGGCDPSGSASTGFRYAEAFQISEYGRRPSLEELAELFPDGLLLNPLPQVALKERAR